MSNTTRRYSKHNNCITFMMEQFFNIANIYRYHLDEWSNMLFKFINQVALL